LEDNRYPKQLDKVMKRTIAKGLRAGAEEAETMAWKRGEAYQRHAEHVALLARTPAGLRRPTRDGLERVDARPTVKQEVLQRGRWQCEWCGGKVIDPAVLLAVADAFPHLIPYYKNEPAHPVIQSRWPAIDHRDPHPRSEDDSLPERLLVACWLCNAVKSDHRVEDLGWDLCPSPDPRWRGSTQHLAGFERRVTRDLLEPDAPRFVREQVVTDRVVERDELIENGLRSAARVVQVAVDRLETLAQQFGLSVLDREKARRIGADPHLPLIWIYLLRDRPTCELDLRHLAAGRPRETFRDMLAPFTRTAQRPEVYAVLPLPTLVDRWREARPVLVAYLEEAMPKGTAAGYAAKTP
jgi:hypothetical protein